MQNNKKPFLRVKDNAVTKEVFDLIYNSDLDLLETYPQPNTNELNRYYESEDYISHTDSKKSFVDRIYQIAKTYMLKKKFAFIKEYKTSGLLLDIGAGTGDFIEEANNQGFSGIGVEPSEKARKIAFAKKIDLKENLSQATGKYDVITMWHVLEHVPDYNEQIKWLDVNLKEDGLLCIAVPNFKSYDAKNYKDKWAAYDVPRHLYHFSQKAIASVFAERGFTIVKQQPLILDSFYVSIMSEKYKGSKFSFLRGIYTGLLSNLSARKNSEYSSILYILQRRKSDF
tara:strand:+ start:1687 stop:2538 length:852 start_codon:yes stop_codon:yes gene_type:complete